MFKVLRPEDAAIHIRQGSHRVIYCAPGLGQEVAAALIFVKRARPGIALTVVLDVSEAAVRLGYSDVEEFAMLQENGIEVRKGKGARLGLLVVDDYGAAFTLPAAMVEDPTIPQCAPNALELTIDQIQSVVRQFEEIMSSKKPASQRPAASDGSKTREVEDRAFAEETAEAGELAAIKARIDENPPVRPDLSRMVHTYAAHIQFVELELRGARLNAHTLKIPREIRLLLSDDKQMQRRFNAQFKLVEEQEIAASQVLQGKVKTLRESFLQPIKGRGTVILRKRRQAFEKAYSAIKDSIAEARLEIALDLKSGLVQTTERLVAALTPTIQREPPAAMLRAGGDAKNPEHVVKYLTGIIQNALPDIERLVSHIDIEVMFKDVTYEMLNDEAFRTEVLEKFPFEDWIKPYSEDFAVGTARERVGSA